MKLKVAVVVGLLAREYQAKVPTSSCMCLIPARERAGVVYFSSTWTIAPYWIGFDFAGACWGLDGLGC